MSRGRKVLVMKWAITDLGQLTHPWSLVKPAVAELKAYANIKGGVDSPELSRVPPEPKDRGPVIHADPAVLHTKQPIPPPSRR